MINKVVATILKHEFLVFFLLFLTVMRIPSLLEPYWYGDEAIYLTTGQALVHGKALYGEIVDHKTPIIYWLAALAYSQTAFKFLLLAFSLVSTVLFYGLATSLIRFKWQARFSVVVFGLLTTLPALEGNIVNGELLLMPFILGAFWLLWWAYFRTTKRKRAMMDMRPAIWGGILFGLAVLVKVPAGLDMAGFLVFSGVVWWAKLKPKGKPFAWLLRMWLGIGAGFGGMILLSGLYFLMRGTLAEYLDVGILYNFRYIQAWGVPFTYPVAIFLATMPGRLVLVGGLVGFLAYLAKKLPAEVVLITVWLVFAGFGALLSLRPYPHYIIQVVPAFCLALGWLLIAKTRERVAIGVVTLTFLGVLMALGFSRYPTLPYYQNFLSYMAGGKSAEEYKAWFDWKVPRTYALAMMLVEQTEPREDVFIWGNEPAVYALSRRGPVGRFMVDFHIQSFEGGFEETTAALAESPPRMIIDTRNDSRSFPELYRMLEQDYSVWREIEGARVYKRLFGGGLVE